MSDDDPNFICPITHQLFIDPVVAADGYLYEKEAIEEWLKEHNTSPMTNLMLIYKHLNPCFYFNKKLEAYYLKNNIK